MEKMEQLTWSKEKLQSLQEEERVKARKQSIKRACHMILNNVLFNAKKGDTEFEWDSRTDGIQVELLNEIGEELKLMFPDSKITVNLDDKKILIDWE